MRAFLQQAKLLLYDAKKAVNLDIGYLSSVGFGFLILGITFLLLLSNSLSPDIVSISLFPTTKTFSFSLRFFAAVVTQLAGVGLPLLIVYGKKGIQAYAKNFALIQFLGLLLALVGFLFFEVFWALYKILPITGLTANAAYEAALLLYPSLVIVVFRYILVWIVATSVDESPTKLVLTTVLHLILCFGIWYVGGLI